MSNPSPVLFFTPPFSSPPFVKGGSGGIWPDATPVGKNTPTCFLFLPDSGGSAGVLNPPQPPFEKGGEKGGRKRCGDAISGVMR